MISHYTSMEGFYNIVENDNLRMTRSEFMNDPSDSKIMGRMIKSYLESIDEGVDKIPEVAKEIYRKATVGDYIDFIQKKIHLYVVSFTSKMDEMEFWNYYGNGGVQLNVEEDKLLNNMVSKVKNKEEYLACAPIIYVEEGQALEDISLEKPLSEFILFGKNSSQTVFKEHMGLLNTQRRQLYEIDNAKKFVDYFLSDYGTSLKYLIDSNTISSATSREQILEAVFHNQISDNPSIIFKKDFLMYMILLSALVKTDSYKYEKEIRIVYFRNGLSEEEDKIKFETKSDMKQNCLRPYVEFENIKLYETVREIVLSPLVKNIPIDGELYKDVMSTFMRKNKFENMNIKLSKHKCRW